MSRLLIKVCGMKQPDNIARVVALGPDLMGFIFYEKSPRYASDLVPAVVRDLPSAIQKVGVFVNATRETILAKAAAYGLDYVQLHGDESPAFAARLKSEGLRVIKVFRIAQSLPPDMADFAESAELFLFDTETKAYGGSGQKFDWELLRQNEIPRPYLLSGGIGPDDVERVAQLGLPGMIGIDLNSRFETAPGMKNIELLAQLISK